MANPNQETWATGTPTNPPKVKQAPKKKKHKGAPIDPQGNNDLSLLAQQRLTYLDQYNSQLGDINRNYRVTRYRMNKDEPGVNRGILSNYAGRGMGYSSGYSSALGLEGQNFQRSLNDLDYQHTLGVNDLKTGRTDYMRTYGVQQQAIRQAAADRLAQKAGTLNLYNQKGPLTPRQIARILAGGG